MNNFSKIVFITSLERSGSTILDLTLGQHPEMISFGEVARVLKPHCGGGMETVVDRPCSCGESVKHCRFWGPLTNRIAGREHELSLTDCYALFLDVFSEVFGNNYIPIDSSKFFKAMDALWKLEHEGLDFRVLFTIRDVRGWILSSRSADRRKREIPYMRVFSHDILNSWRPYLRHNILRSIPFWFPLEWYIRNMTIDRYLRKKKLKRIRLSYEKFALEHEHEMPEICRFIGVNDETTLKVPESHVVRGNRVAFDQQKQTSIRYDVKWLKNLWVQYEPMVWPFVMVKNKNWVYGERL